MENPDRRSARRKQQHASVCITAGDKHYGCDIQLHDISLDGMMVRTDEKVALHANCDWQITLAGPSSQLVISGKGRIVRQHPQGLAIKFTEMEIDSYTYLKTIVFGNTLPNNA